MWIKKSWKWKIFWLNFYQSVVCSRDFFRDWCLFLFRGFVFVCFCCCCWWLLILFSNGIFFQNFFRADPTHVKISQSSLSPPPRYSSPTNKSNPDVFFPPPSPPSNSNSSSASFKNNFNSNNGNGGSGGGKARREALSNTLDRHFSSHDRLFPSNNSGGYGHEHNSGEVERKGAQALGSKLMMWSKFIFDDMLLFVINDCCWWWASRHDFFFELMYVFVLKKVDLVGCAWINN